MTTKTIYFPVKVGLLIVVASYFLFTAHELFTFQWIGEWNNGGSFSFSILIEDIPATIGLIFRFIGSLIAIASVIFYFSKGLSPTARVFRILRWVLVFEGIYWLGLITTAAVSVQSLLLTVSASPTMIGVLSLLVIGVIPSVVESIVLPITLFVFAFRLNPNKPMNKAIKWGFITGTMYIFVFWLTNTSMWVATVMQKGTGYLTSYPENLLSFILTTIGLLALAIYTAYFAKKSSGALQELNLKIIGVIITVLGLYFLWNYLAWIFFGGNYLWSDWYAWFLGHNMDLWMLSLPLLGLPLLFTNRLSKENNSK
ncbi:MAG: hypothetical protein ABSB10_10120 [Candidatus Bathyarchaeia archaeon]|jgi:hypothetical protein